MIGNAHLDPAWLWTWPDGVDESINTCRTACDLLDLYPDLHITRGEAWVYDQVRKADPHTFGRIQAHVRAGRWHIVNGWWIQPDCNLPGEASFLKQAEIGGHFFQEYFGVHVDVGYNVDSFGHCAMLPSYLTRTGMNAYVFMRPQATEKVLPSDLFQWQSPIGDTVTAFRISTAYLATSVSGLISNIHATVAAADRRVGHAMCFYGVGDHGGGPTRAQIEWIRAHRQFSADVELRFSHPRAFFDAVREKTSQLPLVVGELQLHAVGCYTAVRAIKQGVRQGEAALIQADIAAHDLPAPQVPDVRQKLREAWLRLLFNEFHDVLGGSCIDTACRQSIDDLGYVRSVAREVLVDITRRNMTGLPPCPRPRLVICNPSEKPWIGLAEFEPYLPVNGQSPEFILRDEDGAVVPSQNIVADAASDMTRRTLFPVRVPAKGRQILQLYRGAAAVPKASPLKVQVDTMGHQQCQLRVGPTGVEQLSFRSQAMLGTGGVQIAVLEDSSDTWSHGVVGYQGPLLGTFTATTPWRIREQGPLRVALENSFSFQGSRLHWIVLLEQDSPMIQMKLRLYWHGSRQIVKLLLPAGFLVQSRRDGTPGALIDRPLDGQEYPLRDVVTLQGQGRSLAMVSADISGVDVQADGLLRATLLRCPYYANHDPFVVPPASTFPVTDQGMHEYAVAILAGTTDLATPALDVAHRMTFPLWISQATQGMAAGWTYDPDQAVAARPEEPPIMPFEAVGACELSHQLADPQAVELLASETVCPQWPGEKLMVTTAAGIAINWLMPCDARYGITTGYVEGGEFGGLDMYADGKLLGRLEADGSGPRGVSRAIVTAAALPAGQRRLELRRRGGGKTAVGFMECVPVLRDIGGESWTAVGPFTYDLKSGLAPEQLLETMVYAPESTRDFETAVALDQQTTARWTRMNACGNYVDFKKVFGAGEGSIHYAATYLFSPRPYRVRLRYGMDYYLRMWLNGKLVLPFARGHGPACKGQFFLDVDLPAGQSELLVKVAAGSSGSGFWMAVSDLEDIVVRAGPYPGGASGLHQAGFML